MEGPGAGSQGTQTAAMQLLKDSTIIIKNGVINTDEVLKTGIQNYSNLTLDNVKIYGSSNVRYVLSNNNGEIVLKNRTELHAADTRVAFDVYYGMSESYDNPGVHVTIADSSVIIDGPAEYAKASRITDMDQFAQYASLTVPSSMELEFKSAPSNYGWSDNGDGSKSFVPQAN